MRHKRRQIDVCVISDFGEKRCEVHRLQRARQIWVAEIECQRGEIEPHAFVSARARQVDLAVEHLGCAKLRNGASHDGPTRVTFRECGFHGVRASAPRDRA